MGRITPTTRLCDIGNASRDFAKLSKWLFLYTKTGGEKTIADKFGAAQAELIAEALNAWEDDALSGAPVSTNLYSREAIEKDPDKGRTHLFYMAGEPGAPWAMICPGGAYSTVTLLSEGFPVALELNRLGYNAFILCYRVAQHGLMPRPLDDLAAAIRRVRALSDKYNVSKEEYAVLGFSAGGHLAALWGSESMGWARHKLPPPQALLLGYPALSTALAYDQLQNGTMGADGVKINKIYLNMIAGRGYTRENALRWSGETHVSDAFPPVYMLQCEDDPLVSPEGCRRMAAELTERNIPYALRIEPKGGHGFGPGAGTAAQGWIEDACSFWDRQAGREHAPWEEQ